MQLFFLPDTNKNHGITYSYAQAEQKPHNYVVHSHAKASAYTNPYA